MFAINKSLLYKKRKHENSIQNLIITFSNIERCKYVPEFKSTFSELETYEYDYIAILFETLSLLIIEMYEMRLGY